MQCPACTFEVTRGFIRSFTRGVLDWQIWFQCKQAVWSEQHWPNRTKEGCSTYKVHISYEDSVKALKKTKVHFHSSQTWCVRIALQVHLLQIWPTDRARLERTCSGFIQSIMPQAIENSPQHAEQVPYTGSSFTKSTLCTLGFTCPKRAQYSTVWTFTCVEAFCRSRYTTLVHSMDCTQHRSTCKSEMHRQILNSTFVQCQL